MTCGHFLFLWQVRFTLVLDCLPLGDDKTRDVLRDNFSQKGKFDCELSPNQVPILVPLHGFLPGLD